MSETHSTYLHHESLQNPEVRAEYERLRPEFDVLRLVDQADDFPDNTCPASRHARHIGEALLTGESYPLLAEEPAHCGASILATVAALWTARTRAQQPDAWRDGVPTERGLYLTLEPYAHSCDVGCRVWTGYCWQGTRPTPWLWTPFPFPPGYASVSGGHEVEKICSPPDSPETLI